jgi:hypothetical protein
LAGPFNLLFYRPLYEDQLRDVLVKDIAFFCWIGIVWYWVGSKLDYRNSEEDEATRPSRGVRLGRLITGLVFALVLGAIAVEGLIDSRSRDPDKQIALFGLLWSFALALYFSPRLIAEYRRSTPQNGNP